MSEIIVLQPAICLGGSEKDKIFGSQVSYILNCEWELKRNFTQNLLPTNNYNSVKSNLVFDHHTLIVMKGRKNIINMSIHLIINVFILQIL